MKKILIIVIGCVLLGAACHRAPVQQFAGAALGTTYHITYIGAPDPTLPSQVDSLLRHINKTFSIFDTTSLISRVNAGQETALSEDFLHVLQMALVVSDKTGGAFDCTIQPLVELWGFGREGQKQVVPRETIDSVRQFVGSAKISIEDGRIVKADPRVQLNFNAIAKGFAVDKVAAHLIASGYENCIVEIGGEIVAHGTKQGKPWKVGIQTPTSTADGAVESQRSFWPRVLPAHRQGRHRAGGLLHLRRPRQAARGEYFLRLWT